MTEQPASSGPSILQRFERYRSDLIERKLQVRRAKKISALYLAALFILCVACCVYFFWKIPAPAPLPIPQGALQSLQDDTALTMAQAANIQAKEHLDDVRGLGPQPKLMSQLYRIQQARNIWRYTVVIALLPTLVILTVVCLTEFWNRRRFRRMNLDDFFMTFFRRIKPDLAFATAIADSFLPTNSINKDILSTGENSWNHLVLSPHLINSLVMDDQFGELWSSYRFELPGKFQGPPGHTEPAFFSPLVNDRKFQYLLLSIADRHVFWRLRMRRLFTTIGKGFQNNAKTAEKQPRTFGTASVLLALILLLSVLGQLASGTKTTVVQCRDSEKSASNDQTTADGLEKIKEAIAALHLTLPSGADIRPKSDTLIERTFYNSSEKSQPLSSPPTALPSTVSLTFPDNLKIDFTSKQSPNEPTTPAPAIAPPASRSEALAFFTPSQTTDTIDIGVPGTPAQWTLTLQPPLKPWPPGRVKLFASNDAQPPKVHDLYAGAEPTYDATLDADVWIESSSKTTLRFIGNDSLVIHVKPRKPKP